MKKPSHLTGKQVQILRLLSQNFSYERIRERLKLTTACLHTHCYHIRRVTGIKHTQDMQECSRYMASRGVILTNAIHRQNRPTLQQVEVMRRLVALETYEQIATALEISIQTAQNTASQGCKRASILKEGWRRTAAMAEYFEQNPGVLKYADQMKQTKQAQEAAQ